MHRVRTVIIGFFSILPIGAEVGLGQEVPKLSPEKSAVEGAVNIVRLEQVEVEADYDVQTRLPFLPDVEGTRINAGK